MGLIRFTANTMGNDILRFSSAESKGFSGINRDIKLTGLESVVEWKARSPTAIGEKPTPNPKLNVRLWKSV